MTNLDMIAEILSSEMDCSACLMRKRCDEAVGIPFCKNIVKSCITDKAWLEQEAEE